MPKATAKLKRRSKEETSESESDSSSGSESDSSSGDEVEADPVESNRRVSGDKSGSEDDEYDPKDDFLLEAFQPKPVKSEVTVFAKKMRRKFLGTVLPKDERAKFQDDYYCSEEDYKLFAAPQVAGLSIFYW
jgi:hypothetical protein